MLWYSLEALHWGASNEYPQQMFLWKIKKNICLDTPPPPRNLLFCDLAVPVWIFLNSEYFWNFAELWLNTVHECLNTDRFKNKTQIILIKTGLKIRYQFTDGWGWAGLGWAGLGLTAQSVPSPQNSLHWKKGLKRWQSFLKSLNLFKLMVISQQYLTFWTWSEDCQPLTEQYLTTF